MVVGGEEEVIPGQLEGGIDASIRSRTASFTVNGGYFSIEALVGLLQNDHFIWDVDDTLENIPMFWKDVPLEQILQRIGDEDDDCETHGHRQRFERKILDVCFRVVLGIVDNCPDVKRVLPSEKPEYHADDEAA